MSKAGRRDRPSLLKVAGGRRRRLSAALRPRPTHPWKGAGGLFPAPIAANVHVAFVVPERNGEVREEPDLTQDGPAINRFREDHDEWVDAGSFPGDIQEEAHGELPYHKVGARQPRSRSCGRPWKIWANGLTDIDRTHDELQWRNNDQRALCEPSIAHHYRSAVFGDDWSLNRVSKQTVIALRSSRPHAPAEGSPVFEFTWLSIWMSSSFLATRCFS
jgi:hypothetical protein